ncbi:MAG: phytoene/squalene synthase family protein [Thermoguttaceae bacterium]
MTTTNAIIASQRACRRLTREAGSNFPAAFCLLPPAKRQAMHALYAFMRHSDDLADDPPPGCSPRERLRQWRGALENMLSEKVLSEDAAASEVDPCGRAILPAVVQTVREFHIPPELLLAVLDGVEMDLEPRIYATFDELAVYCQRVASAVGLACIHIWGFSSGSTGLEGNVLGPSHSAGLALQLTNILRDLSEDARRGRVYVPLEDIGACGYSAEELQRGVVNRPFLRLMEMEFDRAEQFYREASELPHSLHKDGHRIFGLMMETYHALLHAIRRQPADVFTRRIRVSPWTKLRLAARWTLLPVKHYERAQT